MMFHAKFQDHRTIFLFLRIRFLKVFTIYGHGGQLGHVTQTIGINFCPPSQRTLHIKFGFHWPSSFREEDVSK